MSAQIAIVMGSESDLPVMKDAGEALKKLGFEYEMSVLSAHRTPHEVASFSEGARAKGFRVIIAGAGGAAHLPGMVAAYTELPVIGVPIPIGPLEGKDAFLSIVQMPRGVPVATVAIGNAWNAGVLAAQIIASGDQAAGARIFDRLLDYKKEMRQQVLSKPLKKD
ncbi:MAG: 5-(carboxyamino)imidazole ribonucleotide mutase [Bdellovibrionia bacterium]